MGNTGSLPAAGMYLPFIQTIMDGELEGAAEFGRKATEPGDKLTIYC